MRMKLQPMSYFILCCFLFSDAICFPAEVKEGKLRGGGRCADFFPPLVPSDQLHGVHVRTTCSQQL